MSDERLFTPARVAKFSAWLTQNGASMLEPTNEWEIVRFMAGETLSVIYRNTTGRDCKKTGAAGAAWLAYQTGQAWRAVKATKHPKTKNATFAAIRARDGGDCFYCIRPVAVSDESLEHLVSRTHGGPNHISNYFLAHVWCNARAGHLSAPEKIALHVAGVLAVKVGEPA